MTLPENYNDGIVIHGMDINTWTDAINANADAINIHATALTKVVSGSVNGAPTALTLWIGTAAQYAAIGTKDPHTVYVCTG